MKDPKKYARPCILALEPYSTARDEFKGGEVSVWIDANESPYNHSTLTADTDVQVNRYPDPHQHELKAIVSQLKGVPVENIFLGGAGSDEAIDLLYRIFCNPGVDNVVAMSPSYGVYSVSAAINDVEYRAVPLNDDFTMDAERLLAAADDHTKILWICSPNNPTANAFDTDTLVDLCRRFDGIVAVDEAYVDFSTRGSMLPYVGELRNLVVLQTFSKAWGMASLRLGMAFADPEVARLMAGVKYPYNINGLTMREVARQLQRDIRGQVAEIGEQRRWLEQELLKCSAVRRVYPSDANFLLVRFDDATAMYEYLKDHGILVRNRSTQPLCHNCLRITVGTPDENRRLVAVLRTSNLSHQKQH